MRLWTLHPKYLDRQRLAAVWREALLAQAVLRGGTSGYGSHPQLARFKAHPSPWVAISYYLYEVREEATARGYKFDGSKIDCCGKPALIQSTRGQFYFEKEHLPRSLFAVVVAYAGEVVGMGRVVGDGAIFYYLQDIAVLPQNHGRGLGRRILVYLMEKIQAQAPEKAFIGVFAAAGSERFYEAHGFHEHDGLTGMFQVLPPRV